MTTTKRHVYYVAHPVAGDVEGNINKALRWLAWLRKNDKTVVYTAPWIPYLLAGDDDNDPELREQGLLDDIELATRCNGIVLVGGRVSSGMARERDAVIAAGLEVVDMTHMGSEPPG